MPGSQIKFLRSKVLHQRRKLSAETVQSASRAVTERLIPLAEFRRARFIAAYFPFDNEIDTRFILEAAFSGQKKVFIPVLSDRKLLQFAPYFPQAKLRMNRYGIPEPEYSAEQLVAAGTLDLLIIPLTCFDNRCNRIGMGAGYYDRTLAEINFRLPDKIGLAYELQRVESTFPQAWDIPMDIVVTEQQVYRRH
jgi:5-formyltetrahydrofolate cyclo-ligase